MLKLSKTERVILVEAARIRRSLFLYEDKTSGEWVKLRYDNMHVNYHSGQHDYHLAVYRSDGEGAGNGIMGLLEYTLYNGELTVSMIRVAPKYRRAGIGSRLTQKMKELHPDAVYKQSMLTDDGAKFIHKEFLDQEMERVWLDGMSDGMSDKALNE